MSLYTLVIYFFSRDYDIAGILGSLDEKIELNRKKIAELEALAQTLYDYWFVQFDFPNADGKPYRSSGGKMIYSPQIKREIPADWEVGTLDDALVVCNGKDNKGFQDGEYPVLGSGDIIRYASEFLYGSESVLISRVGTLNNVMFTQTPFWTVNTMFYTRPKQDFIMKYIYMTFKDFNFAGFNAGTGVPRMTSSIIYILPVVIPPLEVRERFDKALSSIFVAIKSLKEQSITLIKERDTLLPLLMNG